MINEFRFAVRMLRKSPSFTIGTVLILSLGIGANTVIFSLVYPALLRALPYPHPEELVMVWESRVREAVNQNVAAPGEFLDWRDRNNCFQAISAFRTTALVLAGEPEPMQVTGGTVAPVFFKLLGVNPALGRTFSPEEDSPGKNRVVVLSHGLWQRRFGADPLVIGKTVNIDGVPFTTIGVLPESFRFPYVEVQAWIPLTLGPDARAERLNHEFEVFARLKAGVTLERARAEMAALGAQIAKENSERTRWHGVNLQPLSEYVSQESKPALIALQVAVGFVLLIACANVANLLMARGIARNREIAVRRALGATRVHLIRQVLVEGAILCGLSATAGVIFASWAVDGLKAMHFGNEMDRPGVAMRTSSQGESVTAFEQGTALNGPVLAFTAGISLLTVLLFGLMPAMHAAHNDLHGLLKEGARASTASRSRRGLSNAFVVLEVSIALVLLAGAGLMIRTVLHLQAVRPGFDPNNVLTFQVPLSRAKYRESAQFTGFYERLLERLRSLPGVEAAGATLALPLSGHDFRRRIEVEGRTWSPDEQVRALDRVYVRSVTDGYFETLHLNLRAGRLPGPSDGRTTLPVAWISEIAARLYWPNESPIGRRLKLGDEQQWRVIAGIVGDVKHWGLAEDVSPEVYVPYEQKPYSSLDVAVRTKSDPLVMAGAVRRAVAEIDPSQPIALMRTMHEYMERSVASRRSIVVLLGIFGVLALILAAGGIFSVTSYAVTERTREMGLRMALGALPADVVSLVLWQGMQFVAVGIVLGLAASICANRLLANLLYGVKPADPLTLAAGAFLLGAVALAANWLPATRATKVDPLIALRHE
jgi:putative ABC transport system permease protein